MTSRQVEGEQAAQRAALEEAEEAEHRARRRVNEEDRNGEQDDDQGEHGGDAGKQVEPVPASLGGIGGGVFMAGTSVNKDELPYLYLYYSKFSREAFPLSRLLFCLTHPAHCER